MKKIEQIKIYYKQVDNLALDKTAKLGLRIVFLSLAGCFLWLAVWWSKLPPEVPLLYSQAYGESRLISQWGLWLLPISSLIIDIISIRLAGSLIENDKLLAQILVWLTVLTNMMALVNLMKIISLVI